MMKGISVNGSSMTQHHSDVKQANYSIVVRSSKPQDENTFVKTILNCKMCSISNE